MLTRIDKICPECGFELEHDCGEFICPNCGKEIGDYNMEQLEED